MSVDSDLIQQAALALKNSQQIAVLTGAGVSKESGVPTFRDAMDGLWAKFDPEQLATPQAFKNNPKLVWDWYAYRREMVKNAKPNPGHYALAELQKRASLMRVITQNVDDLHEQAGSTNVLHLHGNIAESKCFFDCQGSPTLIDLTTLQWDEATEVPSCPHCGRWVRPNVVWFGEILPQGTLQSAMTLSANCDVILVIGTSGLVSPASQLPGIAKQAGAAVIEVNPDYSMITRIADIKFDGASGMVLPLVLQAWDVV